MYSDAIDGIFQTPIAVDATYTPSGGSGASVRVIRDRGAYSADGLGMDYSVDQEIADIRVSDVAQPGSGDQIAIGGTTYNVKGWTPDPQELVWRLVLEET